MKNLKLFLLVAALMILAACGAPAAPAPAVDAPVAAESAGPLELPASVDVQTVADVKSRDDVVVLDVREQWEYDEGHIPGVVHIAMDQVPAR